MRNILKIVLCLCLLCSAGCASFANIISTLAFDREPAATPPMVPQRVAETAFTRQAPSLVLPEGTGAPILPLEAFLSLDVHKKEITALDVSADGSKAYTGGEDGSIVRTTLAGAGGRGTEWGGRVVVETIFSAKKPILALSVAPNQGSLAIAQVSSVKVLNLETGAIDSELHTVRGRITTLAWSPDSSALVLGRSNGDVFLWRVSSAARRSSSTVLETYEGSRSPIVALLFHPTGKAFFAVERNRRVSLWRLIDTEREMGLRDDLENDIHLPEKKPKRLSLSNPPERIEDFWLDQASEVLFATGGDGSVERWRMRDFAQLPKLSLSTDAIPELSGFSVQLTQSDGVPRKTKVMVAGKRDQTLLFWCFSDKVPEVPQLVSGQCPDQPVSVPAVPLTASVTWSLQPPTGQPVNIFPVAVAPPAVLFPAVELLQSEAFKLPISRIAVGRQSAILWVAGKSGSLSAFNTKMLTQEPVWLQRGRNCRER